MKRALLVEDAEQTPSLLQTLLEEHGWQVTSADNGAEALDKARHELPDLVISDLVMPVMDGLMLLRRWRADERLSLVPFIICTATFTDAEDERLALSLGADAFLIKPTTPDDFISKLDAALSRVATGAPRPPTAAGDESEAGMKLYNQGLVRKLEAKSHQLRAAYQALRVEHAELRMKDRAIAALSQGIAITDAHAGDNPIVYASPSFEKLTGYAASELIGRNCRLLQGPLTDAGSVTRIREAIAAGRACTVELLNYRKDGAPFWNSMTISPVLDEQGRLTHFVGVQTDVTERRNLEQELRQSQKMEVAGQLAAGIAHDFNNLLSVILSYSIYVSDELDPKSPLREELDEVRKAGERAAALVRQLMAFSRRQRLQPEVLDLAYVVRDMEKMLRRLVGAQIDLSLLAASPGGSIEADPTQVEQVVMNLAVNARDAMTGSGMLTVEVSNVELDATYAASHADVLPGPYVMLAVSDTGMGMSPSTLEHIFEPFFTTKEKGKGTGLGLATVFGIVKQTRAHLWVTSEPGRGTTFKVYFPRVDQAATTAQPAAAPPVSLRGTETILLVEDDDQVRVMEAQLLRRQGYTVLDAHNGGEAFLIAERYGNDIELLVTDVVLPRMSGHQLAERMRHQRPLMKVLFTSGYTEDAVAQQATLESGAHFLQKPLTASTLLRRVREVLG
ncbi:MAG: response regulator [Myxococcales bacterium]|nr:response regulator [Myxococcales bacterium]